MPSPAHSGPSRSNRWWHFRYFRSRPRWTIAATIFTVMLVLSGLASTPAHALLLSFDVSAAVFLGMVFVLFWRTSPQSLARMARAEDTGRWGMLWGSTLVCVMVLIALSVELHAGKHGGIPQLLMGALSIILSWLFMNTMFAMHYAHGYYGDQGGAPEGFLFPETPDPDYWDFMYLAITLGMAFSVSDVQITGRIMRRTALVHSMVAFFFNAFIIALSVNIVASLI